MQIHTFVPGRPVPKARPRIARGHSYTPRRTVDAEQRIRDAYIATSMEAHGRVVKFTGDVEIRLGFFMPDRRRSDWDNLAKLVCDALNGVAYDDDAQIVHATIFKQFCSEIDAEAGTAFMLIGEEGN